MNKSERDTLRALYTSLDGWSISSDSPDVATAMRLLAALPALLDQVDELERGYQCHFESQRALFDEVATLKAELEALEGNLASVLAHPPRKRADALEAERDALRQEVERLRQTCDIRGANWERDAAELDQARAECERWRHDYNELSASHSQARARVAELERLLIIADAASAILRAQVIDLRGVREQDVAYMARLEAALRKYGRHDMECDTKRVWRAKGTLLSADDFECECGLDAALAGGE